MPSMEIREYLELLRRWWWLIVLGIVGAGAGAYVFSRLQQPVYRATATLLVSEGYVAQSNDSLQTSARLAHSYVQRLENRQVLVAAIDNLGLRIKPDELREKMRVRLVPNTQLIELSVEHTNPSLAQALVNEIPEVFAARNTEQQLARYAELKASLQEELAQLQEEMDVAQAALAEAQASAQATANIQASANDQAGGSEQTAADSPAADSPAANSQPDPEVEQLQNNLLGLRDTHSQLLQSYQDVRVAEASSLNNVIVDEPALRPTFPVRPSILENTILSAILGGIFSASLAFLLEYMDNTVKGPQQLERLIGLSTLGAIAHVGSESLQGGLVVARDPRAPVAEAYRQLRTNLIPTLSAGGHHSILVTSTNAREGKSTTAANLAVALARAGHKVIIVDSDLRKPTLHKIFKVPNGAGLSSLFMARTARVAPLQKTEVRGLRVMTSGPLPREPAELLGTQRMARIDAWLATQAEYVVYDSPPLLAVTDAAVLARLAGATLLVVRTGQTAMPALLAAAEQLNNVGANVAGAVLNRIRRRDGAYYAHYYYEEQYGYQYEDPGRNGQQSLVRSRTGAKRKVGRGW